MWLAMTWQGKPCYEQAVTAIHELGHYLGHRTELLDRYSVAAERDWLMEFFRNYCKESSHEFFADSFVGYILWADEEDQDEVYRPYIDYAQRMGITAGVGGNRFAPTRHVTAWELRTMLDRAGGIAPEYSILYDAPIYKLLSAEIQRGLSLVPDFLVNTFYQEGRSIHATGNPIIMSNGTHLSDQYVGWIQYEGDVWLSVECEGKPYWIQDRTVIHEIGHYLGHRTALLGRNRVPEERDWLIRRYRPYCNENNHEFFADSFVAYVLWPEELQEDAPTVYAHIEACLHEMKSDLEETNHE